MKVRNFVGAAFAGAALLATPAGAQEHPAQRPDGIPGVTTLGGGDTPDAVKYPPGYTIPDTPLTDSQLDIMQRNALGKMMVGSDCSVGGQGGYGNADHPINPERSVKVNGKNYIVTNRGGVLPNSSGDKAINESFTCAISIPMGPSL